MDEFDFVSTPLYDINTTADYEITFETKPNQDMNQASQFIYDYFCPTFIVIGILSNLATLVTLLRPPMSGFSVSVYLSVYCLFAILQWTFIIFPDWLLETLEQRHFRDLSTISCRLFSFFNRIISFSFCWFVIGAAIDRVIVLWFPQKAQSFCTTFMAKNAIIFTLIGLTAVCIHAIWTHYVERKQCFFDFEPFGTYWLYASNFLLSWLPCILLFVLSNMMLIRLCLKNQGGQYPEMSRNEMELTYVVAIVSFLNLILVTPMTVIFLLRMLHSNNKNMIDKLQLPLEFSTYLLWLEYSCVFFVIVIRSSTFRETLREWLSDCLKIFTRRNSNIELQMIKDEYDQVPSTSTSV